MKLPTVPLSSLAQPFVAFGRGWYGFWFTPADPTVLGFIRLCTGLVMLYILVCSGPLLSSFYAPDAWVDHRTSNILRKETPWLPPHTDWDEDAPYREIRPEVRGKNAEEIWDRWNVDPAYTIDIGQPLFSPFFHLTTPLQLYVAHALTLLIAILFTLGVGTRVTSVLAWVMALGYIHRIQAGMFGMDTMLGILLLYLMIGPSGATLSVDRLIICWWRQRKGLPLEEPAPSVSANVALRLLQVHFCIIYLVSGASKMQGPAWWNGTAIWQTLTNYEFAPARFEAFTYLLRLLTVNRWVWEIFHTSGAWGTLALELSLPFLIWYPRWRWLMIIGAVGLHTFIGLAMGLTAFSLLMMCIVFAFVPPETLKAALAWGQSWLPRPTPRASREERISETAAV